MFRNDVPYKAEAFCGHFINLEGSLRGFRGDLLRTRCSQPQGKLVRGPNYSPVPAQETANGE